MGLLILIAVIYIVSVLIVRKFYKLAYSTLGVWKHIGGTSDIMDTLFSWLPVANTIVAFMMLFEPPLRDNNKTYVEILIKGV